MDTRKAYTNVVKVAMGIIFFFSFMSMACDDPCADACGLTAPRTNAEQTIINLFDKNPNDNALP